MKLRRVIVGAALGMVLSGASVFMLTTPRGAPRDEPIAAPSASTSADPVSLTELQEEIARLRVLLDGGLVPEVVDASVGEDEVSTAAAVPDARAVEPSAVGPKPGSPRSAAERVGACAPALPAHVAESMLAEVPALRQLAPELRDAIFNGSPRCDCTAGPGGQTMCVNWCRSKGFAGGQCSSPVCQCR